MIRYLNPATAGRAMTAAQLCPVCLILITGFVSVCSKISSCCFFFKTEHPNICWRWHPYHEQEGPLPQVHPPPGQSWSSRYSKWKWTVHSADLGVTEPCALQILDQAPTIAAVTEGCWKTFRLLVVAGYSIPTTQWFNNQHRRYLHQEEGGYYVPAVSNRSSEASAALVTLSVLATFSKASL